MAAKVTEIPAASTDEKLVYAALDMFDDGDNGSVAASTSSTSTKVIAPATSVKTAVAGVAKGPTNHLVRRADGKVDRLRMVARRGESRQLNVKSRLYRVSVVWSICRRDSTSCLWLRATVQGNEKYQPLFCFRCHSFGIAIEQGWIR